MMNLDALMNHVSRHLHTIVRMYSKDRILVRQICSRSGADRLAGDKWDDGLTQSKTTETSLLESSASGYPKLTSFPDCSAYIMTENEEFLFLTGPVLLTDEIGYRHQILSEHHDSAWLPSLYSCDLIELVTETLILYNLFHDTVLTPQEVVEDNCFTERDHFLVQKTFTNLVFDNQEHTRKHNPYDQEVREFSSIRNGDISQLKKSISEDYVGNVGTLAKTQLRSFQNLAIVIITLASRAAIEGGVLPEISYSLSDSYIQQVEQLHIPEAAIQLARQAEYQYASLVHEARRAKTSALENSPSDYLFNRAKDYMFLHLHEKLSTSDVAKALFVNPNYLSGLFRKKEGVTISQYILSEKIRLVKNMLIYSPYSYSTIASYFGFSSQSHLCRQFKKETGMTLQQYRRTYGKTESFFQTEKPS